MEKKRKEAEFIIFPLPFEKKKKKYKDSSELGFGRLFTDRMFFAEWIAETGWQQGQIKPYEPFILDPSSLVFHYGQEIFEGLKAYKWADGSIYLFRPERNARRFNHSAERLSMPQISEDFFVRAIETLVYLEQEWIPSEKEASLYIRPTMIAVDPVLGVRPASHYYFYIILSPVGPYYSSGFNPVKIWVEDKQVRAAVGGLGEAKTGANYAASLRASLEAKKKGFDQVLWLDGATRSFVEEVGAMNIFFVYGDKIVTPALSGSILHGVTRDSVIQLAPSLGYKVEEAKIDIRTLMEDIRTKKVKEAFGSGTAAVVTPIGVLAYQGESLSIGDNKVGPFVQKLYGALTDIQYGDKKDPFGWMRKIPSS